MASVHGELFPSERPWQQIDKRSAEHYNKTHNIAVYCLKDRQYGRKDCIRLVMWNKFEAIKAKKAKKTYFGANSYGVVKMDLKMDDKVAEKYKSNTQKIRVITEQWVYNNLFCPYCGKAHIAHFENNRPVADFYCPDCAEEYELKSKNGTIESKINDGAYDAMIKRIVSIHNPNFFFMNYDKQDLCVKDFLMVPKYFFSPEIIERRKPLSDTARRAGWIGCNILLKQIPEEGRIFIVKNGIEIPQEEIITKVRRTGFIKQYNLDARGWVLDILNCVNQIEGQDFNLEQIYKFEDVLSKKYPNNKHIKEKIRQQLQILRDKGIVEFRGKGYYRKI